MYEWKSCFDSLLSATADSSQHFLKINIFVKANSENDFEDKKPRITGDLLVSIEICLTKIEDWNKGKIGDNWINKAGEFSRRIDKRLIRIFK